MGRELFTFSLHSRFFFFSFFFFSTVCTLILLSRRLDNAKRRTIILAVPRRPLRALKRYFFSSECASKWLTNIVPSNVCDCSIFLFLLYSITSGTWNSHPINRNQGIRKSGMYFWHIDLCLAVGNTCLQTAAWYAQLKSPGLLPVQSCAVDL